MNMENQTEDLDLVETDPITPHELVLNLLQDLTAGNPPDDLAAEFVEEFVIQGRPEAEQILQMFDTPSEAIVEMLKGLIAQSYQLQMESLEHRGKEFIDGLKFAVRTKMNELAEEAA